METINITRGQTAGLPDASLGLYVLRPAPWLWKVGLQGLQKSSEEIPQIVLYVYIYMFIDVYGYVLVYVIYRCTHMIIYSKLYMYM